MGGDTPVARVTEDRVTVSVGPDGRVYFHDLDADLIRVALALNPNDAAMRRRLELCEGRHAGQRKEMQ